MAEQTLFDSVEPVKIRKRINYPKNRKTRPIAERFWAKVNKDGPVPPHRPDLGQCWVWTASTASNGTALYGRFGTGSAAKRNQKCWLAHRFSWKLAHGECPDELHVCHHCDNPLCVRPDHLFLGDDFDNMQDCAAKGRHCAARHPERMPRGERHGEAKITEDQVREIRRRADAGEAAWRIAADYGICKTNVRYIALRQAWKHVE